MPWWIPVSLPSPAPWQMGYYVGHRLLISNSRRGRLNRRSNRPCQRLNRFQMSRREWEKTESSCWLAAGHYFHVCRPNWKWVESIPTRIRATADRWHQDNIKNIKRDCHFEGKKARLAMRQLNVRGGVVYGCRGNPSNDKVIINPCFFFLGRGYFSFDLFRQSNEVWPSLSYLRYQLWRRLRAHLGLPS